MHNHLKRLPAVRARYNKKRLPSEGWNDAHLAPRFTLTAPITITRIFSPIPTEASTPTITTTIQPAAPPVTSTTTITTSPPASTTLSPPPAASTSTFTSTFTPPSSALATNPASSASDTDSANVAPSSAAVPIPVGSAINAKPVSIGGVSTGSSSSLPTGAVVGITLAIVLLLVGAILFFQRNRAMRQREMRRATAAWAQPRPADNWGAPRATEGYAAYGNGNGSGNMNRPPMAEATPGISFTPAPAPSMPAPLVASYNNPVAPSAMAAGALASAGKDSATVRYEFIPSLPDELSITAGQTLRVVAEYDDGWALCTNPRGEQGMVPLECLEMQGKSDGLLGDRQEYRNSRRTSSLAPGKNY